MNQPRAAKPLARALIILSLVAIITTGASFAALQSQTASLTGNIIESTTADLRIGTSQSSFAASRAGFDFKDVVPGGSAVPADGNTFYLKNYGSANLALKVGIGTAPSNLNNVNLGKVFLVFSRVDTNGAEQTLSLKSLIDGYSSGGVSLNDVIAGGVIAQYKIRVSMDSDAFSGSGATISGIDLVFSGAGT